MAKSVKKSLIVAFCTAFVVAVCLLASSCVLTDYMVSLDYDETLGTVTVDPNGRFYALGDEITVVATPNEGLKVEQITVNSDPLDLGDYKSGAYEWTIEIEESLDIAVDFGYGIPKEWFGKFIGEDEGTSYAVTVSKTNVVLTVDGKECAVTKILYDNEVLTFTANEVEWQFYSKDKGNYNEMRLAGGDVGLYLTREGWVKPIFKEEYLGTYTAVFGENKYTIVVETAKVTFDGAEAELSMPYFTPVVTFAGKTYEVSTVCDGVLFFEEDDGTDDPGAASFFAARADVHSIPVTDGFYVGTWKDSNDNTLVITQEGAVTWNGKNVFVYEENASTPASYTVFVEGIYDESAIILRQNINDHSAVSFNYVTYTKQAGGDGPTDGVVPEEYRGTWVSPTGTELVISDDGTTVTIGETECEFTAENERITVNWIGTEYTVRFDTDSKTNDVIDFSDGEGGHRYFIKEGAEGATIPELFEGEWADYDINVIKVVDNTLTYHGEEVFVVFAGDEGGVQTIYFLYNIQKLQITYDTDSEGLTVGPDFDRVYEKLAFSSNLLGIWEGVAGGTKSYHIEVYRNGDVVVTITDGGVPTTYETTVTEVASSGTEIYFKVGEDKWDCWLVSDESEHKYNLRVDDKWYKPNLPWIGKALEISVPEDYLGTWKTVTGDTETFTVEVAAKEITVNGTKYPLNYSEAGTYVFGSEEEYMVLFYGEYFAIVMDSEEGGFYYVVPSARADTPVEVDAAVYGTYKGTSDETELTLTIGVDGIKLDNQSAVILYGEEGTYVFVVEGTVYMFSVYDDEASLTNLLEEESVELTKQS